jgi:hypothetical protein
VRSTTWFTSQACDLACGGPREHQQAGDDLLDPVQLLDDVVQVIAPRIARPELRGHELDRGADAGQRVADLVRHVGGELAQRHQAVDLLLELAVLALGDGLGDHHRAGHLSVLIPHGHRLAAQGQVAIACLDAEVARFAGRTLEPARVGAGEDAVPGQRQQRAGLHAQQLLDAAVRVDHLALAIQGHGAHLERVQHQRGQRAGRLGGLGFGPAWGGLGAHGAFPRGRCRHPRCQERVQRRRFVSKHS